MNESLPVELPRYTSFQHSAILEPAQLAEYLYQWFSHWFMKDSFFQKHHEGFQLYWNQRSGYSLSQTKAHPAANHKERLRRRWHFDRNGPNWTKVFCTGGLPSKAWQAQGKGGDSHLISCRLIEKNVGRFSRLKNQPVTSPKPMSVPLTNHIIIGIIYPRLPRFNLRWAKCFHPFHQYLRSELLEFDAVLGVLGVRTLESFSFNCRTSWSKKKPHMAKHWV